MAVVRDRELSVFRDATYDLIEQVQASDARTITVTWSAPFIQADTLFSKDLAQPMPKHLLEPRTPTTKRASSSSPSGTLSSLAPAGPGPVVHGGNGMVLSAFDDYVLGRPKIDEIEVRFIPDPSTLLANVAVRDRGRNRGPWHPAGPRPRSEGAVDGRTPIMAPASWVVIFPQFIDPTPSVVGDVRFRRALMHALDRQQIVDTIQSGVTPVAHQFLSPNDPDAAAIRPPLRATTTIRGGRPSSSRRSASRGPPTGPIGTGRAARWGGDLGERRIEADDCHGRRLAAGGHRSRADHPACPALERPRVRGRVPRVPHEPTTQYRRRSAPAPVGAGAAPGNNWVGVNTRAIRTRARRTRRPLFPDESRKAGSAQADS